MGAVLGCGKHHSLTHLPPHHPPIALSQWPSLCFRVRALVKTQNPESLMFTYFRVMLLGFAFIVV